MGMVVGFIVVLTVLYFVFSGGNKGATNAPGESGRRSPKQSEAEAAMTLFNENKGWLAARWTEANRQKEAGKLKDFSPWYFDEATERQLKLLSEKGISLSGGQVSKGQASDVIGLFFPAEDADEEVLKCFKVSTKGMNQTTARAAAAKILADPEKVTEWNHRPADPMQKEFYRYFGIKLPSGLTRADAVEFIGEHSKTLEDSQLDDWSAYESILIDLSDKETCEDYDIKKPPVAIVRAAIDALRASGRSLSDLDGDLDTIAQKIIELKPELERN